MPKNIHKHDYLLGLYINTILNLINDRYKFPPDSFQSFLQVLQAFIEKTKHEFNNHVVLDKIQKAANMSAYCEIFIKEQITTIKNSSPTINQLYVNIVFRSTAQKAITEISFTTNSNSSFYNKANEIVIKLNDKNSVIAFSN